MTIETRALSYVDGDTELTGYFCGAPAAPPRPGILLVHGGAGLDEHARAQSRRYAALGYPVLAADLYGVTGDRAAIMSLVTGLRDDPAALVRRTEAGLTALRARPEVAGPIAVVGFCFGGLAALTLARSGADLAAAISIHGTLATTAPARRGAIRAEILACHGSADPHVPMADVLAFTEEMNQAQATWQLLVHGGAQHGFTHTHALPGATPGVAYDPVADARSFTAATELLVRTLGE